MLRDTSFSRLTGDAGTVLVAMVFLDELRLRWVSFSSHKLYLNAILKMGSGVSLALLGLLSLAQLASCATLLVPRLYRHMGTTVPSMALGTTLALEMLLYHGFNDYEQTFKACGIWLSLFLIGLLRNHRYAKSASMGIPLSGRALAFEANIRWACTKCRAGVTLSPITAWIMFRAIVFNRFWSYTGTAFEIRRTTFLTSVAQCALMLILISEDKSPSVHALHEITSGFRLHVYKRVYKAAYGEVPLGRKKSL
jgi:hypothetical protein